MPKDTILCGWQFALNPMQFYPVMGTLLSALMDTLLIKRY